MQIMFLGTKPHDFDALATRIKPHITKDNCFISIMAGIPIDYIKQQLECQNPVALNYAKHKCASRTLCYWH